MSKHGPVVILSVLLVLSSASCRRAETVEPQKVDAMPKKTIEQVQQEHTAAWMAIPGVIGTAIGERKGKPCILVLTASSTEQVKKQIPATVDGYPVIVQYVGDIRALDKS
jgi:hypothetical protein